MSKRLESLEWASNILSGAITQKGRVNEALELKVRPKLEGCAKTERDRKAIRLSSRPKGNIQPWAISDCTRIATEIRIQLGELDPQGRSDNEIIVKEEEVGYGNKET